MKLWKVTYKIAAREGKTWRGDKALPYGICGGDPQYSILLGFEMALLPTI